MRLLFVAALAALAFATTAAAEHERWPVKTAPPVPGQAQVVPIATLISMPDLAGVGNNDARYKTVRINPAPAAVIPAVACSPSPACTQPPAEGQFITTTGWLHLVAFEGDGDFHIQLSADPVQGSPCLIVEVPDPQDVQDPGLKAQATAVRAWIVTKLFNGKNPSAGGSVLRHPVKVTVSGALFYDDSHVGTPPRGKKGMKAGTLWELHPVTEMAFAP